MKVRRYGSLERRRSRDVVESMKAWNFGCVVGVETCSHKAMEASTRREIGDLKVYYRRCDVEVCRNRSMELCISRCAM
jgi:hypothetical protein